MNESFSLCYGLEWQHSKKINGKSSMILIGRNCFKITYSSQKQLHIHSLIKPLEIHHSLINVYFQGSWVHNSIVIQPGFITPIRTNWYGQQTNCTACANMNEWVRPYMALWWHASVVMSCKVGLRPWRIVKWVFSLVTNQQMHLNIVVIQFVLAPLTLHSCHIEGKFADTSTNSLCTRYGANNTVTFPFSWLICWFHWFM